MRENRKAGNSPAFPFVEPIMGQMNTPAKIDTTYNGWKNRQTWNCALWINNDERLYNAAVAFMHKEFAAIDVTDRKAVKRLERVSKKPYTWFIIGEGMTEERTPDNIAWLGTRLDYTALNDMMRELLAA